MARFLRRIAALLVAVAIPATLLVAVSAQPADAGVAREPAGRAEAVFVKIAGRARVDAMNDRGTVLNYAKARKVFSKVAAGPYAQYVVDWRRQFAAGASQVGTRLTNISSTEAAAVEQRRRDAYGNSCSVCRIADGAQVARNPTPDCGTGRSEGPIRYTNPLYKGRFAFVNYLNSCQTELLIDAWDNCGWAMGAIAGSYELITKLKGNEFIDAAVALMGFACWAEKSVIERYQIASDVRAIIIATNPDAYAISNPNGGQYTDVGYYAQ